MKQYIPLASGGHQGRGRLGANVAMNTKHIPELEFVGALNTQTCGICVYF